MRIAYCLDPEAGDAAGWIREHHRLVIATHRDHGHEVTVFGPRQAVDATVKVDSTDHLIERVYSRSDSYDVIQWYAAAWPLDVARRCPTPTVITVTAPIEDREYYGSVTLVPVSGSIQQSAPSLPWTRTIPLAIDIQHAVYQPAGGDRLIWTDEPGDGSLARRIAERVRLPLQVVSVDQVVAEPETFGSALALICGSAPSPIPALALASGTPLIAQAGTPAANVVEEGETGWIVQSVDDAVARIADLDVISRRVCRREAERRYSPAAVVGDYENLYRSLLPAHQSIPKSRAVLGAVPERRTMPKAIGVG